MHAKLTTRDLCFIGIFTAVIAVMAQIAIPMPLGVPMTLQTLAITLAGVILGSRKSALACVIYLLLGAVGLPVFTGFQGGLGKLVSPTGGFLLSFPLMAFFIGLGVELKKTWGMTALVGGLLLGTAVNYAAGLLLFCVSTNNSLAVGFAACVLPFLPTALIKAVVGALLGLQIRRRLASLCD